MKVKSNLLKQLFVIALIIFAIIYLSLGILLPKILLPIYEKNIYQYLKQPLGFIADDLSETGLDTDVAYLYVTNNDIIFSNNLTQIISVSPNEILSNINNTYGKFSYLDKTYYYYTSNSNYGLKIAITNNDYISEIKFDIFSKLFPILLITFILIILLMIIWSRNIIKKIEFLKEKIENLGSDDYNNKCRYKIHDEFKVLSDAIDNMNNALKEQDEYKSQMYQSISHDFKTPLTVIKSYMEAVEDGIETSKDASKIIKEQVNKLETKVHSLLYLNKLNYIKES